MSAAGMIFVVLIILLVVSQRVYQLVEGLHLQVKQKMS
jgi:hypothetical protein